MKRKRDGDDVVTRGTAGAVMEVMKLRPNDCDEEKKRCR